MSFCMEIDPFEDMGLFHDGIDLLISGIEELEYEYEKCQREIRDHQGMLHEVTSSKWKTCS